MVNAVRTLLLNLTGPTADTGTPGDEYVPPYAAMTWPGYLANLRTALFGRSPDRAMLNYRLRQFMAVLHASPLDEHVRAFDPRITYDLGQSNDLYPDTVFQAEVVRIGGAGNLSVLGNPAPPDVTGQMRHVVRVDVSTATTLTVARQSPPTSETRVAVSLHSNGLSDLIDLPGTGYQFRVDTAAAGAAWMVTILNRPQTDLGQLTANLSVLGDSTLGQLFGTEQVEPWLSYRNLWNQCHELPLRLGAVLLAMAHRLDARKRAGAS